MTDLQEKAMRMALEAFEMYLQHSTKEMIFNQIATARAEALRQALAQQEPDEFCTATTEELMKTLGCSDEKAKEIHDKVEELAQWTDLTEGQLIEALKAANLPSIFSYRAACKIAIDKFKEKNI